jgi:hypothetical protein
LILPARSLLALASCVGALWAATGLAAQLPDTLDGRPYQALQNTRVTVWYAPGDSLAAEAVSTFLLGQTPLPGLPGGLPEGVTAVLTHSAAAFDQVTGGRVPEWRAGVAIPDLDVLVIPLGEGRSVADPESRKVLRHEWAHLGLHQSLEGLRIPRWFDEGYAQWASGGWDASEAWRLRVLIALGRAPPLDSLSLDWPRDRASADAAYLLAASAVAYLLGDSGDRGLEIFLDRWRRERTFDGALRATFGVTAGQFEDDWRRHVKDRYGWLFVLSHSAVFWMLLALVLLLMVRVRHRRNREHMARLRAAEPPDAPAYWADGEPQDPNGGVERPS